MLLELCWIALSLALGAVAAPTEKRGHGSVKEKCLSFSKARKMRAEDANTDKDRMSFLESYADSNVILE